jgi:DNA-binding GntR family transcriptional regulator
MSSDLTAVEPIVRRRGEGAAGATYVYLREMILDGRLAPDTVISQVELAGQLGVSRTPLREALRRLQQEGLIEAEQNRRARVLAIDPDDLEHVYTNRLLYEVLGLAVIVPRLTAADIQALEGSLADMRAHAATGDYAAWEDAHKRFHRGLVLYASDDLGRTIATYADRGDRYRRLYQSTVPRAWTIGDSEHEAIVEACRAGDQREATVQLARHFARTALALIAQMVPERSPVELRTALLLITGRAGV